MGRSSTSGMVYLVKRPEGGFSYIRDLPVDLFPSVSGELSLSWSRSARKVGGRKVLKIALGTADLTQARARWLEVHPQVETLLGLAKARPVLSRGTINDKAIGAISAILAVAVRNGEIDTNPCIGMKFALKEGEVSVRKPYDDEDLKKLLASPVFASGERYAAGGGEAQRWLPLISLFSGARLEEIGQLRLGDLKSENDIYYFDLREVDDTPGQTTSRKTRSSRRRVPIHRILIERGLLKYAKAQQEAGAVRLFPDLREYEGKTTHYFSKWWGRYAREFVTKDRDKTFHSFRHRAVDELRKHQLYPVAQAVLGHHLGDTTSGYGSGFDLLSLDEAVQGIAYPKLDLIRI